MKTGFFIVLVVQLFCVAGRSTTCFDLVSQDQKKELVEKVLVTAGEKTGVIGLSDFSITGWDQISSHRNHILGTFQGVTYSVLQIRSTEGHTIDVVVKTDPQSHKYLSHYVQNQFYSNSNDPRFRNLYNRLVSELGIDDETMQSGRLSQYLKATPQRTLTPQDGKLLFDAKMYAFEGDFWYRTQADRFGPRMFFSRNAKHFAFQKDRNQILVGTTQEGTTVGRSIEPRDSEFLKLRGISDDGSRLAVADRRFSSNAVLDATTGGFVTHFDPWTRGRGLKFIGEDLLLETMEGYKIYDGKTFEPKVRSSVRRYDSPFAFAWVVHPDSHLPLAIFADAPPAVEIQKGILTPFQDIRPSDWRDRKNFRPRESVFWEPPHYTEPFAVSPSGKQLLISSVSGTERFNDSKHPVFSVNLYLTATGQHLRSITLANKTQPEAVAISPDDRFVAIAQVAFPNDREDPYRYPDLYFVEIYDLESPSPSNPHTTIVAAEGDVLAFLDDQTLAVGSSRYGTIRTWKVYR